MDGMVSYKKYQRVLSVVKITDASMKYNRPKIQYLQVRFSPIMIKKGEQGEFIILNQSWTLHTQYPSLFD